MGGSLSLPETVSKLGPYPPSERCTFQPPSAALFERRSHYEEAALTGSGSATLSGLILYFEQLAETDLDLRYTSQGHDAVTLMTYHGAKGLEWPVVVLSGLHSDRDPDMWKPVVRSSSLLTSVR